MIYLDFNATTPVDDRVLATMLPYFGADFGNPSSGTHAYGWRAARAVENARLEVARLLGADPAEIVFTSSATESNYLALLGALSRRRARGGHVITSSVEHKSVLDACDVLAGWGFEVTRLAPDRQGVTDARAVKGALREDTVLVSLSLANNEIGAINPIAEIAAVCRRDRVLLHCDAAQAPGKIPVDVRRLDVDLLSCSAHKVYGPKGAGALFVRGALRERLAPMMKGGGQEGGLRGGTLNVPAIVGFGAACALAREGLEEEPARVAALAGRMLAHLEALPGVELNGPREQRLPGNLNVSFEGIDGEALLKRLAESLAVSAGSACASGASDVSHVLRGIGLPDELARASLRLGFGRPTSEADVDHAAALVVSAVRDLRRSSPPHHAHRAPSEALAVRAIGTVRNDVREPAYIEWAKVRSSLRLDDDFLAALRGLEEYSHLVVVCWLHLASDCKLVHVPQGRFEDVPEVGMFACRCPYRPNPVSVTTVRLVGIDGDALEVEGLDVIDGTPILDVKPYTPQIDSASGPVRVPDWTQLLRY